MIVHLLRYIFIFLLISLLLFLLAQHYKTEEISKDVYIVFVFFIFLLLLPTVTRVFGVIALRGVRGAFFLTVLCIVFSKLLLFFSI